MKRALTIAAFGLASISALGASQAQANTYCAELAGDASCTQHFSGTSTSIQAAVEAAGENPGPDTVKVGPGNFVMSSPVYLTSPGDANKLTLTGSGADTVLSGSDSTFPDIHFGGGAGSSINDLTVSIPDDASDEYKIGLALDSGATGSGLNVTFAQHLVDGHESPGNRTTGVRLVDGATLEDSTVRLYSSKVNDAVAVFGSGNVLESSLTAFRDVYQRNATGTVEIERSALVAIGAGALTEGGTMNIRDSVILNPFGSGDGLFVSSDEGTANVMVDGSTILGAPGPDAEHPTLGAVVQAVKRNDDNPGIVDFRVNDSIVYGHDYAIGYREFFPEDTLTIDLDSSAYDSSRVVEQVGAGTPQITETNPVELNGVDPKFQDPGNGDYSLANGSPLIDAGQAALPPLGSLAYDGNPRACDGNDDGTIRRDIGAFELRTDPNDDCTYPAASIGDPQGAATSTSRTFQLTASKPGSTYLCSLDGGAFSACTTPHASSGLSVGNHTLRVRARDAYGNVQPGPTEKSFGVQAPGCADDRSLCPDTTAPTVKVLSAPKKTRAKKATIRFKASEAATFSCKVNKAKARRCNSPFKVKLRKGRNTIAIVATDRAGNRSKTRKVTIRRK